jgi:hypothetical protein
MTRFLADDGGRVAGAGAIGEAISKSGTVANSSAVADWWSEAESKLFAQWASSFESYNTSYNNPYFEYFYTGQDIQISIDGLDSAEDVLPIYSFGYNVQQQKAPLYGFWDYTYAAMLRGTRIITGAFSIVSTGPHVLTSKIAKAANVRAFTRSQNMYSIRGLGSDEAQIHKYWRKHLDDSLDLHNGQQHLFSIHPPFNFIIQYGLQDTSLTTKSPDARAQEIRDIFNQNDALMSDTNERLVRHVVPQLDRRILLENVELISKSVEYNVDGDPLLETYTFMARDERLKPTINGISTEPDIPRDTHDDLADRLRFNRST